MTAPAHPAARPSAEGAAGPFAQRVAGASGLTRLLAVAFLLSPVSQALACPECTYQRESFSCFYPKILAIKFAAAILVTANRLDVIRVSYTLAAYLFAYVKFRDLLIWYSHPAVGSGMVQQIAPIQLATLESSLPDAFLLFTLGLCGFYRWQKDQRLALWQPFAYLAIVALARCVLHI